MLDVHRIGAAKHEDVETSLHVGMLAASLASCRFTFFAEVPVMCLRIPACIAGHLSQLLIQNSVTSFCGIDQDRVSFCAHGEYGV